jgi:hypothetical protein
MNISLDLINITIDLLLYFYSHANFCQNFDRKDHHFGR